MTSLKYKQIVKREKEGDSTTDGSGEEKRVRAASCLREEEPEVSMGLESEVDSGLAPFELDPPPLISLRSSQGVGNVVWTGARTLKVFMNVCIGCGGAVGDIGLGSCICGGAIIALGACTSAAAIVLRMGEENE